MEFESKILSKSISEMLYNSDKTLGTAESCTGGRIAEAIIAVPCASNYFKGGIVSYTNEVKENLLGVSHEVLVAGPSGGTLENPVGTIWIGYGSKDDVRTLKLTGDFGRDINLAIATNTALKSMFAFLKEHEEDLKKD